MNRLIDAVLDRSRMVLTTLLLIIVAGSVAYVTVPKEADPDVAIPILYVSMVHEGISPEDAERLLVRPMEQQLRSIEGLKEMRSTATEGFASVLLEFEAGFNSKKALDDVRQKVDLAKKDLPDDTKEPTINEVNVALFPVLVVTLSGNQPERTLVRLARELRDDLQGLPGVLSADLAGDREELLEVVVDPLKLESYRISQAELYKAVTQNNTLVAAGALDTGAGRFSIKVPGLVKGAADVLALPLKVSGDGAVTLGDVAGVRRTFKDPTSFARLNGKPAIALEIRKRIGANIIDTIAAVRHLVAERQATWPKGVEATFTQDKSRNIALMLTDLQNNFISAVLLVMVAIIAVLGFRSSLLVGLAIPTSFLIGILVLSLMGLTINIVVLFSLILAVGMLVDDAIIITEYADRKMLEGFGRREAYAMASKRMFWPVVSATATKLAAFLPLLFWPGIVGQFMRYLPLTLITTLTGSLLMALIFLPTLGGLVGKVSRESKDAIHSLAAAETGDLSQIRGLPGLYVRIVTRALRRPGLVVLGAVALLIGVQAYYAARGNGVEFFPKVEPETAIVYVHARGNLSVIEKDRLVREVEGEILALPDFKSVYARTGGSLQGQDVSEDTIGIIQLEFKDWRERRKAAVVLQQIRDRTSRLAGISVEATEPRAGPPTGKDIQLVLSSRDPDLLPEAARKVRAHLQSMSGLIDVEDSRQLPGIEWQVAVDRAQAGRFGADISMVGAMVQLVTNGIKVGEYRPDDADSEIDIRVRYPLAGRSIDQLDQLRVQTPNGLVPISNFVQRKAEPKIGLLSRIDGKRVLKVRANVAPGVLPDTKVKEIAAWLQQNSLGPGVEVKFKGQDEEQKKAAAFLQKAFGVALFIMAIILITQFNSFFHAFLVLTAVIMSTIGVMIGLIVTGQTFSIVMTGIGIVALANIVLIDTYAHLKRGGMETIEAIIRSGAQRLRPVLLTTCTTIVGLVPMILELNIDFVHREVSVGAPSTQWWVQLATAVVFGLGFATILTLIVQPCMLALGYRLSSWRARRRARRATPAAGAPEPAE